MMIYNFLRCGVNDDERWQWLLKNIRILRSDMNELIVVILWIYYSQFLKTFDFKHCWAKSMAKMINTIQL